MGLKLSAIQSFAVEMMMLYEDRINVREQTEQFKLALVSADPNFWLNKLYADQLTQSEEIDLDDTSGTWIMPEITEDEFMALERELANRKGTLTVADLEEGEWT